MEINTDTTQVIYNLNEHFQVKKNTPATHPENFFYHSCCGMLIALPKSSADQIGYSFNAPDWVQKERFRLEVLMGYDNFIVSQEEAHEIMAWLINEKLNKQLSEE